MPFANFMFADFPSECKSFVGPHSRDCLNKLWLKVGCLAEGLDYPENNIIPKDVSSFNLL